MSESIKAMTFNIRGARKSDGVNAWERRADLNRRVIEHYAPDFIGFQEFQRENLRYYRSNLSGYEWVLGPIYENRKPHAFNAIFYRPQSLELLDHGGFWLSETPEEFSGSWNTAQIRSANWARFRTANGAEFIHLNTHLDHKSVSARRKGTQLIIRELDAMGEIPLVVTGDFNAEPGAPIHNAFAKAGFSDAHKVLGHPPTRTFHRFRGPEFSPKRKDREWRIDWVLLRGGWEAHSCDVCHDCEPPIFPSDHYPVMAELALPAQ